jgi:hypothetical protein
MWGYVKMDVKENCHGKLWTGVVWLRVETGGELTDY